MKRGKRHHNCYHTMPYLRLTCIQFNFGWGSAQTPLQELTALSQTPSWNLEREEDGKGGDG